MNHDLSNLTLCDIMSQAQKHFLQADSEQQRGIYPLIYSNQIELIGIVLSTLSMLSPSPCWTHKQHNEGCIFM